eukprot:gene4042-14121_t
MRQARACLKAGSEARSLDLGQCAETASGQLLIFRLCLGPTILVWVSVPASPPLKTLMSLSTDPVQLIFRRYLDPPILG